MPSGGGDSDNDSSRFDGEMRACMGCVGIKRLELDVSPRHVCTIQRGGCLKLTPTFSQEIGEHIAQ